MHDFNLITKQHCGRFPMFPCIEMCCDSWLSVWYDHPYDTVVMCSQCTLASGSTQSKPYRCMWINSHMWPLYKIDHCRHLIRRCHGQAVYIHRNGMNNARTHRLLSYCVKDPFVAHTPCIYMQHCLFNNLVLVLLLSLCHSIPFLEFYLTKGSTVAVASVHLGQWCPECIWMTDYIVEYPMNILHRYSHFLLPFCSSRME